MAIVDTDKQNEQERIFIDPTNFEDDSEAVQYDTDADAYERIAPPPAGRYDLHVTLPEEGAFEQKVTDSGDKYIVANLECIIVDSPNEDANGRRVFGRVSTYLGRGRKISQMAYLLLKMGYPKEKLSGPVTQKELVSKFYKWITKQDRFVKQCLIDWQGWSKNANNGKGAVVFGKMSDFPRDKNGNYEHIVDYKKIGQPSEEITAKLKLKDWGSSAPTVGKAATATGGSTKAAPVVKKAATAPVEDDDDIPSGKVVNAAPAPAKAPAKKAKAPEPDQTELDELLQGTDDED